jgi:hypothetical protein
VISNIMMYYKSRSNEFHACTHESHVDSHSQYSGRPVNPRAQCPVPQSQSQRETPITMVSMYPPHKLRSYVVGFCLDATSQLSLSLGPLSLLCG